MAFEADREYHGPLQQFGVSRSMRHVAAHAAFHAHARVLEREWSALIDMAFEAGLFVIVRGRNQCRAGAGAPRRREAAVWIVAVRALHCPFVDAMFDRHIEL